LQGAGVGLPALAASLAVGGGVGGAKEVVMTDMYPELLQLMERNLAANGQKTVLFSHLCKNAIILPRRARDTHRESTQKHTVFSLRTVGQRALHRLASGLGRLHHRGAKHRVRNTQQRSSPPDGGNILLTWRRPLVYACPGTQRSSPAKAPFSPDGTVRSCA
jgi:hypothetical protein